MNEAEALKEAQRRWGENGSMRHRQADLLTIEIKPFAVGKQRDELFIPFGVGNSWEEAFADAVRSGY
jgi:hypothetical protein